jgi:CubicO group peptidase (beta-lactamase class C family)
MQKRRAWAAHLLGGNPAQSAGQWAYSNMAYVVAGAMLETRAATQWETLLTTRVFAPLGMTHSGFGAPGTAGAIDQPLGHISRSSGFDPVPPGPGGDNVVALGPAGTVHATLDDFSRYLMAHIAGLRGTPGLLTTQSFVTLHTPVAAGYAFGWEEVPALPELNAAASIHNGSNLRWFAQTWLAPTRDSGILVVANGGGERANAAILALDMLMRARVAATP